MLRDGRGEEDLASSLLSAAMREMAACEETHTGYMHAQGLSATVRAAREPLIDQASIAAAMLASSPADNPNAVVVAQTLHDVLVKLQTHEETCTGGAPDVARWTASLEASLPPGWRSRMRQQSASLETAGKAEKRASTAFVTAGQLAGRPAPSAGTSAGGQAVSKRPKAGQTRPDDEPAADEDPRLAGIEPKLLEHIRSEIIARVDAVGWDQIAGLEHAKRTIMEIVIWPMQRPDIFTGLRGPPKGLLLFGPPGTGKTMIGRCIASQASATFFAISASSLTSKWVGEGEKLVRALFAVARTMQPAVIFIDEIDSLLTQRTDGEFEASRRIKTEFLVQFDGAATSSADRILVIGATNRPHELDEAARRRLVKRLYVPLPDAPAREAILRRLLGTQGHNLCDSDIAEVVAATAGYSGSDMDNLCREAALGPIRALGAHAAIMSVSASQVRPIAAEDVRLAMRQVRASVSARDLESYHAWNEQFGSLSL